MISTQAPERSLGDAFAARVRTLALLSLLVTSCGGRTVVSLLKPLDDGGSGGNSGSVGAAGGRATDGGASGSAGTGGLAPMDGGATTNAHLIHRYSFDDEGAVVVDSIGHADGLLMNGALLDGAGHVSLDGIDDYVNLPNGLLSGLTDATIIAWFSWNGGRDCWQRVFDFGGNDGGEDMTGSVTTSIFATPYRCPDTGPATAYETAKDFFGSVDGTVAYPELHDNPLAVVFDVTGGELRLYTGTLVGVGTIGPLSQLTDYNDWLGRSQWPQDPYLHATYDEFRIYDTALTTDELTAIQNAGPNALP